MEIIGIHPHGGGQSHGKMLSPRKSESQAGKQPQGLSGWTQRAQEGRRLRKKQVQVEANCGQMICPLHMHFSLTWNHPGERTRLPSKEWKSDCHQPSNRQPQCKKTVEENLQTAKGMARLVAPSICFPRGRPTGGRTVPAARMWFFLRNTTLSF